jgi:hydrogenase maturation protease
MRTLVGAVGYRNLRDHSAAFEVIDRLSLDGLDPSIVLEDTSYNPIALVQWLQGEPPADRFDRVIFVSALERGRPPGTVTAYRWDGVLPSDELVQQAVAEAVTGIIALHNTVVISGYFKVLPAAVAIVEIEPVDHAFGPELSTAVRHAIPQACALIGKLALEHDAIGALPAGPLPERPLLRAGW